MKIALVYPPCSELNLKGYPLGLLYLAASLKRAHEVEVYNYNGKEYKPSLKIFLRSIKHNKPHVVGISFTSFNRGGAYYLIRRIKKVNPDTIVVVGGVHPSTLFGQQFQYFYDYIDFVVQSEGEISFFKLCNALERGLDYKNISGLVYKDGKGGFIANAVSDITYDLDQLPLPDFSQVADEIKKSEIAYLITSRGCPVNCIFCSTSSFWGQRVRMYSPERIGVEVEHVKRLGAKRVFFFDDTFNLGIERTLQIADILEDLNIEYSVSCRVKPVTEEMIRRLVESGCRHIFWGVETLSERLLGSIEKKITRENVRDAFEICSHYTDKLTTSAYCCVGMPGETQDTINETVDYFNTHIRSTHGPAASILYILPGTKMYNDLMKKSQFCDSLWVRSNSVYYYTQEHGINTLNEWRKKVNRSGIRIPFTVEYFWNHAPVAVNESVLWKRINKIRKKIKRSINLMCNRY